MNENRKIAVLKAGIVPEETMRELTRWGMEVPEDLTLEKDRRSAVEGIREAIESYETVELRTTQLDAIRHYEKHNKPGRLYYAIRKIVNGQWVKSTTFANVSYALTLDGQYLIPWTSEDISDLMLDENTYLKPANGERVYFSNIAPLHYGERCSFMSCTPAESSA